jgi:hypothetical protein
MKRTLIIFVTLVAILTMAIPVSASSPVYWPYYSYPYFFIETVVKDQTVTIHAYNFPANDTFNVTMSYYGSLGIGGYAAGTTYTGAGGSFVATYTIPSALAGQYQIAIRLQSPYSGYYAYNWFYNNTYPAPQPPVTPPPSGYVCCPYFFIQSVVKDQSVTISAYNFPPNDTFTVTMGPYGYYGIGGYQVATTITDGNGTFTATYPIPAELAGSYRIAIRLQSPTTGYYGYNWFYNNTTTP